MVPVFILPGHFNSNECSAYCIAIKYISITMPFKEIYKNVIYTILRNAAMKFIVLYYNSFFKFIVYNTLF